MDLNIFHKFLEIANQHREIKSLLDAFVFEIQRTWECEAVGIRILNDRGDIPYLSYNGFSEHFYEKENLLSIKCDQCMCISVIKGTVDSKYPFFTARVSLFTNSTTRLFLENREELETPTRNACRHFGFESVALAPIRLNDRILGLIHLADSRTDQFSEQTRMFEVCCFTRQKRHESNFHQTTLGEFGSIR